MQQIQFTDSAGQSVSLGGQDILVFQERFCGPVQLSVFRGDDFLQINGNQSISTMIAGADVHAAIVQYAQLLAAAGAKKVGTYEGFEKIRQSFSDEDTKRIFCYQLV